MKTIIKEDTLNPAVRAGLIKQKGEEITREVSAFFKVPVSEIMGSGRTRQVSRARHLVMAALWQMGFSKEEVASYFSRRVSAVKNALSNLNVGRFEVRSKMVKQPINLEYNTNLAKDTPQVS